MLAGAFLPPAERRSLLDRAHGGDIQGALGRVTSFDTAPRHSLARRLGTFLAIMGPGVIVLAGDNDAGSISLYGQAGQNYGLSLIWLLVPMAAILFINQEMVARLGAVTGAGHARLIYERFGSRWGAFALGDLIALAFLTIVTEFIGVDLAAGYLGIDRLVSVPAAAVLLIAIVGTGSFRRWERAAYLLVAIDLLVVPLALLSKPRAFNLAAAFVPGTSGTFTGGSIFFMVALIGATVTPWQLFFHQSNVVDKRITSRWLSYERVDTLVGTVLFTLGAAAVMAACAFAFDGTSLHGAFVDAGGVARGLDAHLGHTAGIIFMVVLLNGSLLGAMVVALGASYAVGDVFGTKHSLHRRIDNAGRFYGVFGLLLAFAAGAVLAPDAPLGLVTSAVQALAGILLPSALVFLLLLCNDRDVLGPWTNSRWLNAVATGNIAFLLFLSALLTFADFLPGLGLLAPAMALGAAVGVVLAMLALRSRRSPATRERVPWAVRASWTMPQLESLPPPKPSTPRTLGLVTLRVYLTLAAAFFVVRIVQLIVGA